MTAIPIVERSLALVQRLADIAFELDPEEIPEFWRINHRRVLAAAVRSKGPVDLGEAESMSGPIFRFSEEGLRRIREASKHLGRARKQVSAGPAPLGPRQGLHELRLQDRS